MRRAYSWSGLRKRPQASQRGLEVVDKFRIRDSLVRTSDASGSLTRHANDATRCTSNCAPQHFCDNLRCLVKSHQAPHAAPRKTNIHRNMTFVRGQAMGWSQPTIISKTPDTTLWWEGPNERLPIRALGRHPREGL
jgi:hypothetical protein